MADNTGTEQKLKTGSGKTPEDGQHEQVNKIKNRSLLKQKRVWIPFFIILVAGIVFWFWYKAPYNSFCIRLSQSACNGFGNLLAVYVKNIKPQR